MGCLGDCWDLLGPPPDSILFLPPPPLPAFLQPSSLADLLGNNHTFCTSTSPSQLCESASWTMSSRGGGGGGGGGMDVAGDYVELPRKDIEGQWNVASLDDTWLLVLVASSIGVLLLGALLAMFLLKCRELTMFGSSECTLHHHHHPSSTKNPQRECGAGGGGGITPHDDAKLVFHYAGGGDNRLMWAALTPHGTQHFIADRYADVLGSGDYNEADVDSHYESVDHLTAPSSMSHYYHKDVYDYEEPTPLIESYHLDGLSRDSNHHHNHNTHHHHHNNHHQYATLLDGGNTDMRCMNTLHRATTFRPRVSSPTRIEHPNLPPLNLHPHHVSGSNSTLARKNVRNVADAAATLPKYA